MKSRLRLLFLGASVFSELGLRSQLAWNGPCTPMGVEHFVSLAHPPAFEGYSQSMFAFNLSGYVTSQLQIVPFALRAPSVCSRIAFT